MMAPPPHYNSRSRETDVHERMDAYNIPESEPWQLKWKRPRLHGLNEIEGSSASSRLRSSSTSQQQAPVSSTSARLTEDEAQAILGVCQPETILDHGEGDDYVLTVTILASFPSTSGSSAQMVGDVLVLELACASSSTEFGTFTDKEDRTVRLLASRTLRWPSSALEDFTATISAPAQPSISPTRQPDPTEPPVVPKEISEKVDHLWSVLRNSIHSVISSANSSKHDEEETNIGDKEKKDVPVESMKDEGHDQEDALKEFVMHIKDNVREPTATHVSKFKPLLTQFQVLGKPLAKSWADHVVTPIQHGLRRKKKKPPMGIVGASFCRRRRNLEHMAEDATQLRSDALDVVRLMTLGLGGDSSNELDDDNNNTHESNRNILATEALHPFIVKADVSNTPIPSQKDKEEEDEKKNDTHESELLLSCLASNGKLHLFSPMDLFLERPEKTRGEPQENDDPAVWNNVTQDHTSDEDGVDDLMFGMASLLLGHDLHAKIRNTMLPLIRSRATIDLNIVSGDLARKPDTDYDEATRVTKYSRYDGSAPDDEEDEDEVVPWIDLSLFDANVETSTFEHRTVHNKATMCVSAFDYVVIGGRGTRKRRRRVLLDTTPDEDDPLAPLMRLAQKFDAARTKDTIDVAGFEETPSLGDHKNADHIRNYETGDSEGFASIPHKNGYNPFDGEEEDDNNLFEAESIHESPRSQQVIEPEDCLDIEDIVNDIKPAAEKQATKEWAWEEYEELGGFVTVVSLRYYSEAKTIFLPFVPIKLSPVAWNGMHFVIILGSGSKAGSSPPAVAVRVDSSGINIASARGEVRPLTMESAPPGMLAAATSFDESTLSLSDPLTPQSCIRAKPQGYLKIRRFRLLPIILPVELGATPMTAIGVTSILSSPPAIAISYIDPTDDNDICVSLYTLNTFVILPESSSSKSRKARLLSSDEHKMERSIIGIETMHRPGHTASFPTQQLTLPSKFIEEKVWCQVGQGWSLVGVTSDTNMTSLYFVCWEGASSSHGAHVTELLSSDCISAGSCIRSESTVLPLNAFANDGIYRPKRSALSVNEATQLPFTSSYSLPSVLHNDEDFSVSPFVDGEMDPIVSEALDSISDMSYLQDTQQLSSLYRAPSRRRKLMNLSHKKKSELLLQHCSSWKTLEGTKENRAFIDGQAIMSTIICGPLVSDHMSLTMRSNVISNGIASPFYQVLAWFCQHEDYYTAASVALNLLHDYQALRDLRGLAEDIEDERSYLRGLLDGIVPLDDDILRFMEEHDGAISERMEYEVGSELSNPHTTLTSLADMTVGCLLKGGVEMSHTLTGFLSRNLFYDASRACLMLVATASCFISGDNDVVSSVIGVMNLEPQDETSTVDEPSESILWPIRCLLQVGVTRDCMPTALMLLNATIPNELRHRELKGGWDLERPPLVLCKAIVTMIVSSSPDAAGHLLNITDEESQVRYWHSLNHDTQLELSLISIEGTYPFLRQPEVRAWAMEQLNHSIEEEGSGVEDDLSIGREIALPSDWLEDLCTGCLCNANIQVEGMVSAISNDSLSSLGTSVYTNEEGELDDEEDDDLTLHYEEIEFSRSSLVAEPGSGGLDFDLIIPALLLLEKRCEHWRPDALVSTQTMLDAACFLAGRHSLEEPAFAFDGSTVMRQCAISGNVSAGAHLIGGRDGLVLMCCDILMQHADMKMDVAERSLLSLEISPKPIHTDTEFSDGNEETSIGFRLSEGHRHILWLLDEHVLSLKTFGEFETVHIRGRVDPVFAAKICLRTWYYLMHGGSDTSTQWLVSWLQMRLEMNDGVSRKRLACAALTRTLIWPAAKDDNVNVTNSTLMWETLGVEPKFLVQLVQSCCGLVEALSPPIAEGVLSASLDDDSPDSSPSHLLIEPVKFDSSARTVEVDV